MLLRSITLQNFGLYAGRQVIELSPQSRDKKPRPIVLIGGKNGAGKTSLLDGVRLALYGKLAVGQRVSQVEYESYLRSRIHTPPSGQDAPSEATIVLDFDFAEGGEIQRYEVTRSWAVRGQSVVESLEVTKNGSEITAVPREEWHHFLQDLLPFGVSQLFFFDGEKIKDIADDTEDDEHLAGAIRTLLGIEMVVRLRTDLGLYIARHERANASTASNRLDQVVRDLERLAREIQEATETLADLQASHDGQKRSADKAKQRFVATGGDIALNRSKLQGEREAIREQRDLLLQTYREGSASLWPLVCAPKLLGKLLATLPDIENVKLRVATQHMLDAFEAWQASAAPAVKKRWTDKHRQEIRMIFQHALGESSDVVTVSHPVAQVPQARERIETALERDAVTSSAFAKRFAQLEARVTEIDSALARVDETTSDYLFDELRAAEQACGATQSQIDSMRGAVKDLRYRQTVLERERKHILDEQSEITKADRQVDMAARAAKSLSLYESALVTQKTRALERAFVTCFNRLARKDDLVRGVRIDDQTFQATLIDSHGVEVPKTLLSAGEKQVYAIAMLWALAKTSGRSLPVIIDTPLARLDSDHRATLIERYFPEVSHQVIVLSTDTEIDEGVVEALHPFVSHSYLLDYLPAERRTLVLSGYFGRLHEDVRKRHALQQA